MKIKVRPGQCQGHARCAAMAPAIFDLDPDGYIAFTEKDVPPEQAAMVRRGVRACPERALYIEGDPLADSRD